MQYPTGRYIKDADIAQAIAADWVKTGIDVQAIPASDASLNTQTAARAVTSDLYFWGSGFSQTGQGDISQFVSTSSDYGDWKNPTWDRSEEHTSELQSHSFIS